MDPVKTFVIALMHSFFSCIMLHLQPLLEQSLEPVEYLYFMKGLPLKSCSYAANFISLSKSIHLCSSCKNSKNHNNSDSYKLIAITFNLEIIPIDRIQVIKMRTQTVTRRKTRIISPLIIAVESKLHAILNDNFAYNMMDLVLMRKN